MSGAEFPVRAHIDTKALDTLINYLSKAGKAAGMTEKEIEELNDELKKVGLQGIKSVGDVNKSLDHLVNSGIKKAAGAFAGLFAAQKIIQMGKEVFNLASQFQRMSAVLTNTLGSRSAAQKALNDIQKFAAATPFQITELTESFVKLANQGFVPTTEELRKLGDLASSVGKSFDQLTEAIIDAQTGEFERLKEFGIRASKEGDKVTFTFKGVKQQVDFTGESIRKYILSLGDLSGVSGSMAAISQTLGGKFSNLMDNLEQLGVIIGNNSSGLIGSFLDFGNRALESVNDALNDQVVKLEKERNELNVLVGAITDVNVEEDVRKRLIDELNQKYPDFLKNLDAETVTNEQLKERLEDVNQQFQRKILLVAAEKELAKTSEAIIETVNKEAEARKTLVQSQRDYNKEKEVQNRMAATGMAMTNKAALDAKNAEMEIQRAQAERSRLQSELTEKLKAYNDAFKLFDETSNDYFEDSDKNQKKEIKQTETQLGLIQRLEEEIKKLEEAKKKAFDIRDIEKYNDQIKMLQARLDFVRRAAFGDYETSVIDLGVKFRELGKIIEEETAGSMERANNRILKSMKKFQDNYEKEEKKRRKQEEEALQRKLEWKLAKEEFYIETLSVIGHEYFERQRMQYDNEMAQLAELRDHELAAAGDNARAKEQINKKFNEKEKQLKREQAERDRDQALFGIGINTAQAVMATLARTPLPAGAPFVGLTVAAGLIQAGVVATRPLPKFKDGVYNLEGPGTATSDSILARLSRGESVVPTDASQKFGFLLKPMIENPSLTLKDVADIVNTYIPPQLRGDLFQASKPSAGDTHLLDEVRGLRSDIGNLQQLHIDIDEDGFNKWVGKENSWTKFVGKRYRA